MSAAKSNTVRRMVRSKDELTKEIGDRMRYFYGQTDGTMRFPSSKEGDLLKIVHVLLTPNASDQARLQATAEAGCSAPLSPSDVATVRRWARQVAMMADVFLDDRAEKCRAASQLLFEITRQNR